MKHRLYKMSYSAGVKISHYADVSFKRLDKIAQTGAKKVNYVTVFLFLIQQLM